MGSREELREMLTHMERYKMQPVIDQIVPLAEAERAFSVLEDSQNFGKVVLITE